ncbi:MAG: DUF1868 domain-containing protein [Hydrococcus sp. CRU_1_1]|nr:DUF1868 domain-containing protein [Hydrococcus sp. CRU_1_1]NJQ98903.1 DUF1868 domain-containing protein [Hydrococcus sp. CSU_1_8]
MDETYQNYVNRMARLTLPSTYETQLQHIQKSPKFKEGIPVPFPGFSAIAPLAENDSQNSTFFSHLETSQQQLLEQLDPGLVIPIPAKSFHLTIADLIWDSAYKDLTAKNPDFDPQLQKYLRESFHNYKQTVLPSTSGQWQLLGLIILPRALVVGLVPTDEADYEKIIQLRRSIYQNANLISLGIEQQYYLTGHVTLGYFGEIQSDLDRDRMVTILSNFNDRWLESEPQFLKVDRVQLHKFNDMTRYWREPDWPIVEL